MKRLAILLLAAPLAGCSSLVDNEELGRRPIPSGGEQFSTYSAIGTSIGAGIQSAGINDSTQREAYTTQLAEAMGLTPGVDWFYPSFAGFGCPAPFTNPLTQARLGGGTPPCSRRDPASVRDFMHNVSIPSIRAAQVLDITALPFPATDSLKLAQFITGSLAPIDMVERARPTFVTVEIGANDVLGAATRGDATLLTPLADFQAAVTGIFDRLTEMTPEPNVAVAGIPPVTRIPYLTLGQTIFCLKTGACGVAANPLFTNMTVDASCAPPPTPGGVGNQYAITFPALATVVGTLQAGGAATLNCATDVLTTTPASATPLATVNVTEWGAINARVNEMNAFLTTEAQSRGYAFVDVDAIFTANAAQIPSFPNFTNPSQLFGALFSLDGVHPTKAGHRLLAQGFAAAINATYGSTLSIP